MSMRRFSILNSRYVYFALFLSVLFMSLEASADNFRITPMWYDPDPGSKGGAIVSIKSSPDDTRLFAGVADGKAYFVEYANNKWYLTDFTNFCNAPKSCTGVTSIYPDGNNIVYAGMRNYWGAGHLYVCENPANGICDSTDKFVDAGIPYSILNYTGAVWDVYKYRGYIYVGTQDWGSQTIPVCKPSGFSPGGASPNVCDHANDWAISFSEMDVGGESPLHMYFAEHRNKLYATRVYGNNITDLWAGVQVMGCDPAITGDPDLCEQGDWFPAYNRTGLSPYIDGFVRLYEHNNCLYGATSRSYGASQNTAEVWRCCADTCLPDNNNATWQKVVTIPGIDEVDSFTTWQGRLFFTTGHAGGDEDKAAIYILNDDNTATKITDTIGGIRPGRIYFTNTFQGALWIGSQTKYSTPYLSKMETDINCTNDVACDSILDTDNDIMPDYFEIVYGLNPNDPSDANIDSDGDGRTNLQEYLSGTNPSDTDTDNDGVNDGSDICPLTSTLPVQTGGTYYSSLQSAYNAAYDESVIQSVQNQFVAFQGDFNINRAISVIFNPGFDCGYTAITGQTMMQGNMRVSGGTLRISNGQFRIKQ